MLVGAIRWIERRPAINDHARTHLGWLLAALAVALAWGYLLEPYEVVAGSLDLLDEPSWRTGLLVSPLLAGVALATGALSVIWAPARPTRAGPGRMDRPGRRRRSSGTGCCPRSSVGSSAHPVEAGAIEQLERLAYGLEALRDSRSGADRSAHTAGGAIALEPGCGRAGPAGRLERICCQSTRRCSPARASGVRCGWSCARIRVGRVLVSAIADHRVSRSGEPLFYRLSDTLAHSVPTTLLDLPPDLLQPEAPDFRLRQGDAPGVPVGLLVPPAWSWPGRSRRVSCWEPFLREPASTGGSPRKSGWRAWRPSPTGARRPPGSSTGS